MERACHAPYQSFNKIRGGWLHGIESPYQSFNKMRGGWLHGLESPYQSFNKIRGGWLWIKQHECRNAGESDEANKQLRERLLQDRAAMSVVTALLMSMSLAMLLLDPSTISHIIMFSETSEFPWLSYETVDVQDYVAEHHTARFGLVRTAYVIINVVSTMFSFASLVIGTKEYLLINKCPTPLMDGLVEVLHSDRRPLYQKMLEPYKSMEAALYAIALSMLVLIFGLYGPGVFCFSTVITMFFIGLIARIDHLLNPVDFFELVEKAEAADKAADQVHQRLLRS